MRVHGWLWLVLVGCGSTSGLEDASSLDAGSVDAAVLALDLSSAVEAVPRQGFLYFGSDVDAGTLAPLKPAFWRTTVYGTGEAFAAFTGVGAKVSYVVSDAWQVAHPDTRPWNDWAAWEQLVQRLVTQAQAANLQVAFWDVWNEPESTFQGTSAQLQEAIARATAIIRAADPSAQVVAPSMAGLSTQTFPAVLSLAADLADAGTHLDALSWHAFAEPDDVPVMAQRARAFFVEHPALCAPHCPQLHVNEYSSGQHDHVPGWTLAWLAAFERAQLDWVTKACWSVPGSALSGCGHGLGGLLLEDGRRQATWHVHEAWARLATRAVVTLGAWVAVGGVDEAGLPLVLLGRRSCGAHQRWCTFAGQPVDDDGLAAEALTLDLTGLPASTRTVTVARIPRTAPQLAVSAPVALGRRPITLEAGHARVSLPPVPDGDVWLLSFDR
jgi:hypothetical protein